MVCAAVGRRRRRATRVRHGRQSLHHRRRRHRACCVLEGLALTIGESAWSRVFAVLVALAAFVAAVNLPILVGWQIFGRTWFAEEVDVLVTAPLAMLLGQGWLRFGFRAPQGAC